VIGYDRLLLTTQGEKCVPTRNERKRSARIIQHKLKGEGVVKWVGSEEKPDNSFEKLLSARKECGASSQTIDYPYSKGRLRNIK